MRKGCWIGALVAVTVGAGAFFGYRSLPYYQRNKLTLGWDSPFDELRSDHDAWVTKSLAPGDDPKLPAMARGMMLQDLLLHHLRQGMSEQEVRQLLGRPDSTDATQRTWNYELGSWSGFRMDGDIPSVEYDATGHVSYFWAWQS